MAVVSSSMVNICPVQSLQNAPQMLSEFIGQSGQGDLRAVFYF